MIQVLAQQRSNHVHLEVRVRDLLTHNAGLPNADFLWYEQDTQLAEILQRMRYLVPGSSLRSSFTYQNIMYAAAGRLIEISSGLSWFDFMDRRMATLDGIAMKRRANPTPAGDGS
jgi:CubicO group peptidase (beta-lactamase class C family)